MALDGWTEKCTVNLRGGRTRWLRVASEVSFAAQTMIARSFHKLARKRIDARTHLLGLVLLAAFSLTSSVALAQDARALTWPRTPTAPREAPYASFGGPAPGRMRLVAQWDSVVADAVVRDGPVSVRHALFWGNLVTLGVDLGDVVVHATVPLAFQATPGFPPELGNIEVEALGDVKIGPEHRLLIGGGLALPTATDPMPACSTSCSLNGVTRMRTWAAVFRHAPAWSDQTFTLWPALSYTLGIPWFLLEVAGALPIFFPIEPHVGGPQPLARGQVEVMMTLEVAAALRVLQYVDVGASFLGWALPSAVGYRPAASGVPAPQSAQAAVTFFVRTDAQLDSPIGGGAELIYGFDAWDSTLVFLPQLWSARLFLTLRIDAAR